MIAGYHWFNDWGRDTMIALPGLTLATGRPEDAAGILRTFARYVADGLLPNNFPDHAGVIPGYNTVDATLWYAHAIYAYHAATGDTALVDDLLPILRDIADHHIAGTRYGIGMDPADALLRAGEPGVQLTWLDVFDEQIAAFDAHIQTAIDGTQPDPPTPSDASGADRPPADAPSAPDGAWTAQAILDAIPGIGLRVAETILAELGTDMRRFPDAAHASSWAGLAPGQHESAGKRKRTRIRERTTATPTRAFS